MAIPGTSCGSAGLLEPGLELQARNTPSHSWGWEHSLGTRQSPTAPQPGGCSFPTPSGQKDSSPLLRHGQFLLLLCPLCVWGTQQLGAMECSTTGGHTPARCLLLPDSSWGFSLLQSTATSPLSKEEWAWTYRKHLQSFADPQHPGCAREHHPNLPETLGFLPGSFNPKFNICYPLPSPQPSLPQVRPPWCSPPWPHSKGEQGLGSPSRAGRKILVLSTRSWGSPYSTKPHCWVTEGVQALLCSYSR